MRLHKDHGVLTLEWNEGSTFIEVKNDWPHQWWAWKQVRKHYNWVDFNLCLFEVTIERSYYAPGWEVELMLLGVGLRFRHNYSWEGTPLEDAAKEAEAEAEASFQRMLEGEDDY